jgi:hypothetical protein
VLLVEVAWSREKALLLGEERREFEEEELQVCVQLGGEALL